MKIKLTELNHAVNKHNFISPSHFVSFPLQVLFAWQNLSADPRIKNPSSQYNSTLFGYVVKFPKCEPLRRKGSDPQSTAV